MNLPNESINFDNESHSEASFSGKVKMIKFE
jgi:hypothetical protein